MGLVHRSSAMSVRFWGVRGGIPAPGEETLKFGGNTSCLEVRFRNDHIDETFVIDCGTGSRELGRDMMGRAPVRMRLLFTDYRWDHIQGFPFFTPVYIPSSEIHVYGPKHDGRGVREMLAAQMRFPVFPIQLEHLNAKFSFHDLRPGESFDAGVISVTTVEAPGGSVGYRLDGLGKTVVCLPDSVHGALPAATLAAFCRKATVIVFNSSVCGTLNGKRPAATREVWKDAVAIARAAKAKKLAIFHHAPEDDDKTLLALERRAKRAFPGTLAAYEGLRLSF